MSADARPRAGSPARARTGQALGVVGELSITLGVLLGLFVVWQLWWTDVVGVRAQAQVVAALDWPEPAPAPGPGDPADPAPELRRDPAPVIASPAYATTFATMVVPRWGPTELPISQGTAKRQVLDALGVGHYEGTALPGQVGNFAVAGHRTTYGKPFARVEELVVGDPVVVRTPETWYVYRVTATAVVRPSQVEVIAPVPGDPVATPTAPMMTLTTCHPMYSARERYVVHLLLDGWLPVDAGTPVELAGA